MTTWICLPKSKGGRPRQSRPRGRPFVLSQQERAKIVNMLQTGWRQCEIIRILKVERHHVNNIARKLIV